MQLLIFSAIVLVTAILAVGSFALRPMLDARVLRIMAGESLSPSPWHNVYVGLEALKALLVLVAAIFAMQWERDASSTCEIDFKTSVPHVRSVLRTLGEQRAEAQRKGPERQHPGGCGNCQRGLAPDVKGGEQAGCRGDDDGGVDQLR